MKSTSSCQTVESVSSRTNACDKSANSLGRGLAPNKRKPTTLQVGYNAGQNSGKSGLAVGNNAVTNNKKSASTSVLTSTGDSLLQNQHNMNMTSGLAPTSNHNTLVPVQHLKPATKQADTFALKNQESKNAKKQDFKIVPEKEKSAVFLEDIRLVLPNSDFSNDIFSSLQVPSGSQHHGSLSPTAAFLDAFPLVSNSKNSELLIDGENNEAVQHAGETLLQLGDTAEGNILDTTGTQNCQQVLNNYNNSNIPGAHLAMNNDEITKNPCSKSTNSLHSDQLKTGSTGQQLQTSSHSISALNATKPVEERCTEQSSKIQDYQSHYNVQYNYLSANSFQNYNYNSGYKKVAPKFAESANYSGSAVASAGSINNTGFGTNSQQFRDVNKMAAATNHAQTNESRLNYNTYNNWNTKSAMQLQNADDYQANYMSSYNHFPTSGSVSKNVFGSDPSFSTGSTIFGNLPTYKNMETNGANESSGFVSQLLPVSSSGGRKIGGKSSNSDAPANFIYTQASTSSNPVTTHSYSCVFSSASNFQASVGFPQPFYSSSAIDDSLNTAKVASASKDPGPGQCSSTVIASSVPPTSIKPVNSSKSNSSSKFYPGANNASGKKPPAMFDNSLNKTVHQSNASTPKSSSYLPTLPTTLNANSFGNNANSTLFTGQTSYQTVNVFSSSGSGANTTTTLANSKDGELVKTSSSTSSSQLRMPVNWMTMPDPRTSTLEVASSSASSSFIAPDRMFTPHKDVLDFIAPIITGCGNLQPTYSSMNNNSQMFYGLDFPASDVSQQPCGTDVSNSKPTSTAASQQAPTSSSSIHYSWPTNKSSLSLLSHLDNHGLGIPSTLPTLVGDLALGTNTGPSTPAADGGFRVSSNVAANIFQTLPEVEERGNQLTTKPSNVSSDMPVKSSNYVLDLQPKSSTLFPTEVPSKSSNYFDTQSKLSNFPDTPTKSSNFSLHSNFSTNVQLKPSNVFNVPSKSSTFQDTPAKSTNFHLDMPAKSTNCLNVQTASKPSNFFNVQPNSSNCINRTSKSSNFSMDGQPQSNSTVLQFNRNNDAKITESSKNQAQNQGNVADSNKMSSSNNHSQQQQPQQIGGSFLSVSQLVDQVKTNNKQERINNANTYKYVQNVMPPDIYCPETSVSSGRQSGSYKYNATQQKGVTNNFQMPSQNVK
ncbi:hypothetical protein LSTR_LSTR012587 [Laodelphax striatellus]|uniref:Uncharacterized protein n=1 Tax=Laodelphax striatellus TaxID=195883 RepID=A0A482X9N2_LAOST|nr:hypothetical protein LSTR_LSTR012587 [Laodelphax striatellus]